MLSVQLYTCTQPSSVPSHMVDWARSMSSPPSDLANDVVDETFVIEAWGAANAGDCSFRLSRCRSTFGCRDEVFNWAQNSMSESLSLELLESSCKPSITPADPPPPIRSSASIPPGNDPSPLPLVFESRDAVELECNLLIKFRSANATLVPVLTLHCTRQEARKSRTGSAHYTPRCSW